MAITTKVEELLCLGAFFLQHLVSGSVYYPFSLGGVCSSTD